MRGFTSKCSVRHWQFFLLSSMLLFGCINHVLYSSRYLVRFKYYITVFESNSASACEIKKGNKSQCSVAKDGCVPFFVASYPGSGGALMTNCFEALSGVETVGVAYKGVKEKKDVYNSSYFKTHQPVFSGIVNNAGNFSRAILIVRNPLDAIPSFHSQKYERRHGDSDSNHTSQAPLDSWISYRDKNFIRKLDEWRTHFETWMSLDLDERLVISFENLLNNDLGPIVLTRMALFFNRTGGVVIPDREKVKCVWYEVVKRGKSKRRQSHRERTYDPPYTQRQLEKAKSVLNGLIRKYENETITRDLRRYKNRILDKPTAELYRFDPRIQLESKHAATMTKSNNGTDINGVKKQQQQQIVTNGITSNYPAWLTNYITQHNFATENGTSLNTSHPYLIYTCNEHELCGGIGDRVMGMIKAFYLAVYSGRTLIIDDAFPHPISDFLEPSKLFWNVSFPETKKVINMLGNTRRIGNPKVVGYRLGRANGWKNHFFFQLMDLDGMEQFMSQGGGSFESRLIDAFRLAFETLFQFSDAVKKRSAEMMMSVRLQRDFETTMNRNRSSYIGLHYRSGDDDMINQHRTTTTNATAGIFRHRSNMNHLLRRRSNKNQLLTCYRKIQRTLPGEYQLGGYLATDSHYVKEWMHLRESSVRYVDDMIIYHVDKSSRKNNTDLNNNTDRQQEFQGSLDTYAELFNLINADFLILSNSGFSFLAYYIRDPRTSCNVHVEDCTKVSIGQRKNLYYYYESMQDKEAKFFKKLNDDDDDMIKRSSKSPPLGGSTETSLLLLLLLLVVVMRKNLRQMIHCDLFVSFQ